MTRHDETRIWARLARELPSTASQRNAPFYAVAALAWLAAALMAWGIAG